jgi:hypothetical protein
MLSLLQTVRAFLSAKDDIFSLDYIPEFLYCLATLFKY